MVDAAQQSPEPAPPDSVQIEAIRQELRQAVVELREHGLTHSAAWAAEQLHGLRDDDDAINHEITLPPPSAHGQTDAELLAKCYFDAKEYRRAAHVLREVEGSRALFLRCYALYLAGEKRKEEERVEKGGPLGKAEAHNRELLGVERELREAVEIGLAEGLCLYLLGVVLAERSQLEEATAALLQSLHAFPCNWAGWQALQQLTAERETVSDLSLPQHWMRSFFLASHCLEIQHNTEALNRLQELAGLFPASDWVLGQVATAQYNLRNFDMAQQLFEELRERDPHRSEGMDIYSNILYVKEDFAALSNLAHRAIETDKYRPESVCIVGNYYSLKGQPEKAVVYFRRALKLNPNYLSAWTLMGHEYMEMKNTPAAIEAYRRAVDVSPRDYRAWYGLGQTYELLHMPHFALYYYRRATQLRPEDARMWCAMGQCYEHEQLSMDAAAMRCYRRALTNGDREHIAMHKLAELHSRRGERNEAAHYYKLNLEAIDTMNLSGTDAVDALQFLAQHYIDTELYREAEGFAMRLLDYGPTAKEKAKTMLRDIHQAQKAGMQMGAAAAPQAAAMQHTPIPFAKFTTGPGSYGGSDPGVVDSGSDIEAEWSP